jgi:hypothetical protein
VIEKYEMVRRGDVRRAKLYYLRDLRGKAAKIKEKRGIGGSFIVEDLPAVESINEAVVPAQAVTEVENLVETPVVETAVVEEAVVETPAVEAATPEATPEA